MIEILTMLNAERDLKMIRNFYSGETMQEGTGGRVRTV